MSPILVVIILYFLFGAFLLLGHSHNVSKDKEAAQKKESAEKCGKRMEAFFDELKVKTKGINPKSDKYYSIKKSLKEKYEVFNLKPGDHARVDSLESRQEKAYLTAVAYFQDKEGTRTNETCEPNIPPVEPRFESESTDSLSPGLLSEQQEKPVATDAKSGGWKKFLGLPAAVKVCLLFFSSLFILMIVVAVMSPPGEREEIIAQILLFPLLAVIMLAVSYR